MALHPLAGQPAPKSILVNVPRLISAYYVNRPDVADPAQRVAFGTSGHRGSSLRNSFNEAHLLATTQAICDYRSMSGTRGPLFLGKDTHALSEPSFITALESIGDTNVIASPRLLVLNKHRAEILIGKELGYVSTTITETSASQTVDFLKVGAQLIIRPFISNDGLIRMEVHPELSTGSVQITNNFTVPNKDTTQVTTNIMVPDGVTVIIGGLMREDLQTTSSQLPFLGNLPLVGAAFRNKTETTTKQEIIVLITPHIMGDYQLAAEGKRAALENANRQQTYAESMSPLGKRSAARHYLQRAREASAAGRPVIALRFARLAVHFDPTNLEAIALRDSLEGVCPPESADDAFLLSPTALDGDQLPPAILDALEATPPAPPLPSPPPPPGGSPGEVRQP